MPNFELIYAGYSTIPDYLRYRESYPSLVSEKADLKDVQRPWALEKIKDLLPQGAGVVDLGGSRAELADALSPYSQVTVIDPYDGSGNGPTNVDFYRKKFPKVTFRAELLTTKTEIPKQRAVVSTSVVEHIAPQFHAETVAAIDSVLEVGGYSVHAVDLTCRGRNGFMESQIDLNQSWVDTHCPGLNVREMVTQMLSDVETFFLPVTMYVQWKKTKAYEEYPWRNVGTLNTVFRKIR